MQPQRINILGASGCGASTTGRALAAELSVPHFDSDDYYHAPTDPPFHKQRSPQERHDLLVRDLRKSDSWVLSGGVVGWVPEPQLDFTLIVFLWIPKDLRMERLHQREARRYGSRILEGGDMFETHHEFMDWTACYDVGGVEGKTLPRHEAYLAAQSCPVLELRQAITVAQATQAVLAAL